jgi:ATP-dependent helicase HepA
MTGEAPGAFQGMIVALPGGRGVGKLRSANNNRCTVEIFYSIVHQDFCEFEASELERAYLSPQTRVYVRDGERFKVGRVTHYLRHDSGLVDYEVRFPNGRQADFSETDLFVRPWNAPGDPAEVLGAGGAESQFLHSRRQGATTRLLELRSACQGLTALISSGVDLVPHQVAAVRRVLTDPIQRYLLADEVGLGKTIEAGLIVRQHLIDNPETGVLVATPAQLCDQWRSELNAKLRLDQFGETVEYIGHADLTRVSRAPDILVIDEAHHLVGVTSGELCQAAMRLQQLAADVPVLLLLSATPVLGDEARFLALLNLLDPDSHPLSDLEGFRLKLEQRREFGRILLSLDAESPGLVLRQRSAELERLLLSDGIIAELAPKLAAATRENPEHVPALCAALKDHIADSYRIHQRLIRSRRADAKGWEFLPRGPQVDGEPNLSHVKTESDPQDLEALLATLDDWRFAAAEAALAGSDETFDALASRYTGMLESFGVSAVSLLAELDQMAPLFEGEQEFLDELARLAASLSSGDPLEVMAESTRRLFKTLSADTPHPKVVAFSSSSEQAAVFAGYFADSDIPAFLLTREEEGCSEAAEAFTCGGGRALLICDPSGEEGLNLACADAIVHLDLPFSATRLEQRIGRLDRFGRRQGIIRHRIMLPSDEDESPWTAWLNFLSGGFLIFNQSSSDIQFLVEDIERGARRRLMIEGPAGLAALSAETRERVREERRSQDEQYALDRIALAEQPVEDFIDAIDASEEDEATIERDVEKWLTGVLLIKKRPFAWPAEDPFKLAATPGTLIPRVPWIANLELDDTLPFTWRRRIAARDSAITLLRPGAPLVDMLDRFTRWDDRGTAFVTWRIAPELPDAIWIGFQLCFVIEPDLELSDLLAPSREELALVRRAQAYLAPQAHGLFLDVDARPVTDPLVLSLLERPYRKAEDGGGDINLASRPHLLSTIIDLQTFADRCRAARDTARQSLASLPEIRAKILAAETATSADLERRRNRLNRRVSAGDKLAKSDIERLEELLPAIRKPAIRLEAMGAFILSPRPPRRPS